ncbi:MAG: hypothetical protein J1F11_10030 [Oscillospiraceae bacterium]|nr:hypothetical protein [Oscillospiraceae bacterium]
MSGSDRKENAHNKEKDSASVESFLKRAFMFLEDEQWEQAKQYCEKVLDRDPENGRAYLGKLMADVQVRREADLAEISVDYRPYNNFEKAIRFGDPQLVSNLKAYAIEAAYNLAVRLMDSARLANDYRQAADQFRSVAGYKDADELAWKCKELEKEKKIEAENDQLRKMSENKYTSIYEFILTMPIYCFLLALVSFFSNSNIVNYFIIAIISVIDILCISCNSYLYNFIGIDKQRPSVRYIPVIMDNCITSGSIALIVSVMKLGRNDWADIFWKAFIILSICSLIGGFIGDRLGKRKAEGKSKNKRQFKL